ncbi:MAG: SGNH/GDSL hydrolase family protein, partial [Dietzia sp.]|nr:SGNH/GDSL hydrolase family protein [Dietzia sp.]
MGDYAEANAVPPVYADRIAAAAGGFAADGMFARLDMRDPAPVIVAQASDSTGDPAAEWFETAWKESLAALWPERPARVYRWDKPTDTYPAPTQWQQGTPALLVAGADTFATDGALAGRIPDAGAGPWETVNGTWVVSGGGISQTDGASFGNAGFPVLPSGSIDGTYTATIDMVGTGATQTITFFPLMGQVSTSGNRFSVSIAGSGGLTCFTRVMANGTETTLGSDNTNVGTLATGQVTTLEVELVIDGLTVNTSINGTVLGTYTLTQAQRDALAGKNYAVFTINKSPDTKITAVSVETTDSDGLGVVTAYNGGYAGGRLSHQLDRLAAMFPVRPDVMFINHGHNYATDGPAFLTSVDAFAAHVEAAWPGVPIVVISQNPEFPSVLRTSAQVTKHRQRQMALRSHCRQRGWVYIPA